jgi:flagellar biosynthesis/type III secretory pathway protein FliH
MGSIFSQEALDAIGKARAEQEAIIRERTQGEKIAYLQGYREGVQRGARYGATEGMQMADTIAETLLDG